MKQTQRYSVRNPRKADEKPIIYANEWFVSDISAFLRKDKTVRSHKTHEYRCVVSREPKPNGPIFSFY